MTGDGRTTEKYRAESPPCSCQCARRPGLPVAIFCENAGAIFCENAGAIFCENAGAIFCENAGAIFCENAEMTGASATLSCVMTITELYPHLGSL